MKMLSVSLVQSCNMDCRYCPMKQWMKPLDYVFAEKGNNPGEEPGAKFNSITNGALLKWMDAYIPPNEWLLDLTGGEPGLYPEIDTLIPALSERGYRGIIRTNGTLPIPADPNFIRAACWHEEVPDIPPYHDVIQILEPNPDDDTERKKRYCEEHNIPYAVKLFVPFNTPNRPRTPNHVFEDVRTEAVCRILSMGQVTACHSAAPVRGKTIFNMTRPLVRYLKHTCPRCTNIFDVERFIPEEWFNSANPEEGEE